MVTQNQKVGIVIVAAILLLVAWKKGVFATKSKAAAKEGEVTDPNAEPLTEEELAAQEYGGGGGSGSGGGGGYSGGDPSGGLNDYKNNTPTASDLGDMVGGGTSTLYPEPPYPTGQTDGHTGVFTGASTKIAPQYQPTLSNTKISAPKTSTTLRTSTATAKTVYPVKTAIRTVAPTRTLATRILAFNGCMD